MQAAVRAAAVMGFLGVALGAFGAHKLQALLTANGTTAVWQTAVLYQLVHAVAGLFAATRTPVVTWLWTAGIVVFSGSLYILALTNFTKLGMITPVGGLLFLIGWVWLAVKAR